MLLFTRRSASTRVASSCVVFTIICSIERGGAQAAPRQSHPPHHYSPQCPSPLRSRKNQWKAERAQRRRRQLQKSAPRRRCRRRCRSRHARRTRPRYSGWSADAVRPMRRCATTQSREMSRSPAMRAPRWAPLFLPLCPRRASSCFRLHPDSLHLRSGTAQNHRRSRRRTRRNRASRRAGARVRTFQNQHQAPSPQLSLRRRARPLLPNVLTSGSRRPRRRPGLTRRGAVATMSRRHLSNLTTQLRYAAAREQDREAQ